MGTDQMGPFHVNTNTLSALGVRDIVTCVKSYEVVSYIQPDITVIDSENVKVNAVYNDPCKIGYPNANGAKNKPGQYKDYSNTVVITVTVSYRREEFRKTLQSHLLAYNTGQQLSDIGKVFLQWYDNHGNNMPLGELINVKYDYVIPGHLILNSAYGYYHKQTGFLFVPRCYEHQAYHPASIEHSEYNYAREVSAVVERGSIFNIRYVCNDPDRGDKFLLVGGSVYRLKRTPTDATCTVEGYYTATNEESLIGGANDGVTVRHTPLDKPVADLMIFDSLDAARSSGGYIEYLKYLKERDKLNTDGWTGRIRVLLDLFKQLFPILGNLLNILLPAKKSKT